MVYTAIKRNATLGSTINDTDTDTDNDTGSWTRYFVYHYIVFHFYDNFDNHDDHLSDECKSSTYNVAGTIVSGRGVVPESTSVFFPPLWLVWVAVVIQWPFSILCANCRISSVMPKQRKPPWRRQYTHRIPKHHVTMEYDCCSFRSSTKGYRKWRWSSCHSRDSLSIIQQTLLRTYITGTMPWLKYLPGMVRAGYSHRTWHGNGGASPCNNYR